MSVAVEGVETTRTEAIFAAHQVRWCGFDEVGDEGRCPCGAVVHTEEHEAAHIDQAVIGELGPRQREW